jgi:hypothetical protein
MNCLVVHANETPLLVRIRIVGLLKVYEKPKQRIIYIIYALWGLNKEKQGKVSGK